ATDFSEKRYSIKARYRSIDVARRYFEESPLFGVGVGLRKEMDATNVFWFTLAETGILGLATFGLIHVVFFAMIWRTQKRLSRRNEMYSFLAIGSALLLGKLTHGMVDHYWSRGQLMMAWASVGMATSVYYAVRY